MTREKDSIPLGTLVKDIEDALGARIQLLREWALHWILAPVLLAMTFVCLSLIALDATHCIPPMRDSLLSVVKLVLGGEAVGGSAGAGFGWLFNVKPK